MCRWSKGRQFTSFNIVVTLEVHLKSLVAHLAAALLCTASTLFISLSWWGYLTVEAYSSCGLTWVL